MITRLKKLFKKKKEDEIINDSESFANEVVLHNKKVNKSRLMSGKLFEQLFLLPEAEL